MAKQNKKNEVNVHVMDEVIPVMDEVIPSGNSRSHVMDEDNLCIVDEIDFYAMV